MLNRRGFVGSLIASVLSMFGIKGDPTLCGKSVHFVPGERFDEINRILREMRRFRVSRRFKTQIEPTICIHRKSGAILDNARLNRWSLTSPDCEWWYVLDGWDSLLFSVDAELDHYRVFHKSIVGEKRVERRKTEIHLFARDEVLVLHGLTQGQLELDMEMGAFTVNEMRDILGISPIADERGDKVCWWYEDLLPTR